MNPPDTSTDITTPSENIFTPESDLLPGIISFEEYRRTHTTKPPNPKRGKSATMNYLNITFLKTLTDLPTNKEFGASNEIVLRTKLTGADEMYMADINGLQKSDSEGKLTAALTSSQVLVKLITRLIVSWTFKDLATGLPYVINEENVEGLYREDFDYLAGEFNTVFAGPTPAVVAADVADPNIGDASIGATDPKVALTETEKNSLSSGSENASVVPVTTEPTTV
jgi:hypothetical protein